MRTLVLRDAYDAQNVVGMSVVGPDFEKLKRYNLEELRQPLLANDPEVSSVGPSRGDAHIVMGKEGSPGPA